MGVTAERRRKCDRLKLTVRDTGTLREAEWVEEGKESWSWEGIQTNTALAWAHRCVSTCRSTSQVFGPVYINSWPVLASDSRLDLNNLNPFFPLPVHYTFLPYNASKVRGDRCDQPTPVLFRCEEEEEVGDEKEAASWVCCDEPGPRVRRSPQDVGSSKEMNCLSLSKYWAYSSMSLCPAPSTHSGSTARGQRSYMARPWEKSMTSSSVPWITSTGDATLDILSMLCSKKRQRDIQVSVSGDNRPSRRELTRFKWRPCCSCYIWGGSRKFSRN